MKRRKWENKSQKDRNKFYIEKKYLFRNFWLKCFLRYSNRAFYKLYKKSNSIKPQLSIIRMVF